VVAGVLLIVFPMQGFEIVPVPGSHVRSAARAIPLATVGSLLFCAGLYAVLHLACVDAVPGLAGQSAPLVAAAACLGRRVARRLSQWRTNISALGIAFGMMR